MIDLAWYPFFEIGLDFIDQDHRKLLTIMQSVQSAVHEKDYRKCSEELQRLLIEARGHFDREEAFLAKIKFPDLEGHAIYHQGLVVQAERIRAICEGTETHHDLQACFDEMTRFLIDDILRGDLQFKSYLEHEGFINPAQRFPQPL